MLIKEYKIIFFQELSPLYDIMEIESFFHIILEYIHQKKRIDLALNPALEMNSDELLQWKKIVSELKKQKPIQYILGETEFYGLKFLVNENTLIPRPETEELVQLILEDYNQLQSAARPSLSESKFNILDIGTGSGCIAISLAKNLPNAKVHALDVSEKALEIAKKNAKNNEVQINIIQANILNIEDLNEIQNPTNNNQPPTNQFNIIVSNPPYVRNLEKHEIKNNVLDYEPHLALFVEDNDALLFYRKIAALAKKHLNKNGKLYFEINQYLGKETVELVERMGFKNVILKKDIYGNDRMVRAEKV